MAIMAEEFDIYVFDLDGTLLDTLEDLYLATNAAMRHVGAAGRTKDEVRSFVGNGIKLLIMRALGARAADEAVFNRAFSYFKEYYGAHMYDREAGRRKGGVYRRFGSGYRNGEKRGIAVYFGVLGI